MENPHYTDSPGVGAPEAKDLITDIVVSNDYLPEISNAQSQKQILAIYNPKNHDTHGGFPSVVQAMIS